MRILDKLGLLDKILQKVNPAELKARSFSFYEGLSDSHEPYYTVSILLVTMFCTIGTNWPFLQYPSRPDDKAIGIHR